MTTKEKKSLNYYMRALHRDIGFLVIGFTLIFCISGILLIFRETDFLKQEQIVEKTISPNMESSKLAGALHLHDFKVLKEQDGIVYFQDGTYDTATGHISYKSKELPSFLNKLNNIHKSSSRNVIHWFTLIYGVALLFLAISSFWMYKPKTKMFRRNIFVIEAVICFVNLRLSLQRTIIEK
ncbi:MAG: PepSY domain-containing protein [Bacteroidales bacterium]